MSPQALSTYAKKRNFTVTPEPRGSVAKAAGHQFVIQKHAASHLHYDFRLEAGGVLKSWAVPKGPSTDPTVKRLAMQVEDHPRDYAGFEGVIPAGQYGGGNVIVWDRGTYENLTTHQGAPVSLEDGLARGHIAFRLNGEKLHGTYALTRTGQRGAKNAWLLVKMREPCAETSEEPVLTRPQSVLSGRNVEELSEAHDRLWQSNRAPKAKNPIAAIPKSVKRPAVVRLKTPTWVDPMLATLVEEPFNRAGWIFEPKLDGERCLAFKDGKSVRLFSRNQKDLTALYPEIVASLKKQPVSSFVLDGEIVAFAPGAKDVTSFRELQKRMHLQNAEDVKRSKVRVHYYVFDLPFFDGLDLRPLPLSERKKTLRKALRLDARVHLNSYVETEGETYYREACRKQWEGLIAKRLDSAYAGGRSRDWLKFKCLREQEFVIGGYTRPKGSRDVLGALLLGYYNADGLQFAGKVGTGFDQNMLAHLAKTLLPLRRKTSPFVRAETRLYDVVWTEPKLVAEVVFGEWTEDGKLRHPRFVGLRDDKAPADVRREEKVPLKETPVAAGRPQTAAKAVAAPKKKPATTAGGLTIDGKEIKLSNLDKVFYPSSGFTKQQVLDYYIRVASTMLPYVKNRPVTMKRYPNGVDADFFYEKQAPSYHPHWFKTFPMTDPKSGRRTEYLTITDTAGLVWIANLACLEFHVLMAAAPKVDQPTAVVFDLDPGPGRTILDCIDVALTMRKMFASLKLQSFAKVSGNKGLHLYVPLNTTTTYDATSNFARAIALLMERDAPKRIVSNMRKELREGKIFVDWSQNSRHKTTVAAYSLRATSAPSVSAPVTWTELERALKAKDGAALRFTPEQVLQRLEWQGDLFAPVLTLKQKLPPLRPESVTR